MRRSSVSFLFLGMGFLLQGCPEFPLAQSPVALKQATGAVMAAAPTPTSTSNASPAVIPTSSPLPAAAGSPAAVPSPSSGGQLTLSASSVATGSWSSVTAMSRARQGLIALSVDGQLLVSDGDAQEVLEIYDPPSDTWGLQDYRDQYVRELKLGDFGHSFACGGALADGRLVMAGGYNGASALSLARIFSPNGPFSYTLGFSTSSDPAPRMNSAGAVLGTKLYVAGGMTAVSTVSGVFKAFDVASQTWVMLASLPTPVAGATAVAYNGTICVLGGFDASYAAQSLVQVYTLGTDSWSTVSISPLPAARHSGASVILNDQICVAGGVGADARATTSVLVYDAVGSAWRQIAPMASPRALLGAGVVLGKLYVVGGCDASGSALRTIEAYAP